MFSILFSLLIVLSVVDSETGETKTIQVDQKYEITNVKQLIDEKKYDEALLILNYLLEKDSNDTNALHYKGIALYRLEKFDESLESYELVLEREPSRIETLNAKSVVFISQQKIDEAIQILDEILKIDPNYVPALINKALILGKSNQIDESIELLQRALDIEPENGDALNNMGLALKEKNNFPEAMEYIEKAIEINPDKIEYRKNKHIILDHYQPLRSDGFVQSVIRDKNGFLVAYIETDRVWQIQYPGLHDIMKEISTQINFTSNDESYTLYLWKNHQEYPHDKFVAQESILKVLENDGERISAEIFYSRLHSIQIAAGDVSDSFWYFILPD